MADRPRGFLGWTLRDPPLLTREDVLEHESRNTDRALAKRFKSSPELNEALKRLNDG